MAETVAVDSVEKIIQTKPTDEEELSIKNIKSRKATMSSAYLKIFMVVVAYWTISISMVFANKYLLGNRDAANDVSLFVAWVQCVVCVCVVIYKHLTRGIFHSDWSGFNFRESSPFIKPIMVMTCCYVGMLTFNNLCLKNVGVAFYQVARSLTLIFVVIFSVILLKKTVSPRIVFCCLMVAGGFVLGVDQENLSGTLSISGVCFGMVTSLFVSLNGIFTKTALDSVERDSVKLTFYNNINAVILFLPFVLGTGQMFTVFTSVEFLNVKFWVCLLLSGVLSFAIAWISAVQIDLTSPVTHHISANAKAVLQTLIAVLYNGEEKSLLWWMSILMVVGGALSYAVCRIKEEKKEKKIRDAKTKEKPLHKVVDGLRAAESKEKEALERVTVQPDGRDRSNTR